MEPSEELLRLHVVPALGARPLQRVSPTEIDETYTRLETRMSTRTMHHVHTVLGACLRAAVRNGLLAVSSASIAEAPIPGESEPGQVLDQDQLTALLSGFRGSVLYPIVAVAAFTGARRNEILALRWSDFVPVRSTLIIACSLEETKAHGRRFKEPKTRRCSRTIAIDDGLAGLLSLEQEKYLRLAAGVAEDAKVDLSLVKLPDDALMFPSPGEDITRPRDARSVEQGIWKAGE